MKHESDTDVRTNGQAFTSRLVFYANGALALGIIGLISTNPILASGWLYASLVLSALGVLMSLAHLTAVDDFPAELAEADDFIDSLNSTLEEISKTHDQVRSQLDDSHEWSREYIEWWEDKIAMLSYALREGNLGKDTADDVRDLLTKCRFEREALRNTSSESQVNLARAADGLSARRREVQKTISKEEWWRDSQRRVFEHGETVARVFLIAAITLGLVGIASISIGS